MVTSVVHVQDTCDKYFPILNTRPPTHVVDGGRWRWCLSCVTSTWQPSSASVMRRGRRYWCMNSCPVVHWSQQFDPNQVNAEIEANIGLEKNNKIGPFPHTSILCIHLCAGSRYETIQMTFQDRLKIAQGAAYGLLYLHTFAAVPIIHRDIKPDNILLGDNFNVTYLNNCLPY